MPQKLGLCNAIVQTKPQHLLLLEIKLEILVDVNV